MALSIDPPTRPQITQTRLGCNQSPGQALAPVTPDPACARFYENDRDVRTVSPAQVRQPIHAKGLGRWRAYTADLAPLIAELDAAGMLAEWDATAAR